MHPNSVDQMRRLITTYLKQDAMLSILDVGSFDVNGTYKPLFDTPGWKYTGADIVPGRNVDLVLAPEHGWGAMPEVEDMFDVVVSGQVMEHVLNPFKFAADIGRACKVGGTCLVLAPWQAAEHKHPIDCWRILPDGMRHVMEAAGYFETLECITSATDTVYAGRKK